MGDLSSIQSVLMTWLSLHWFNEGFLESLTVLEAVGEICIVLYEKGFCASVYIYISVIYIQSNACYISGILIIFTRWKYHFEFVCLWTFKITLIYIYIYNVPSSLNIKYIDRLLICMDLINLSISSSQIYR